MFRQIKNRKLANTSFRTLWTNQSSKSRKTKIVDGQNYVQIDSGDTLVS